MRSLVTMLLCFAIGGLIALPTLAQEEGDFRTRDSGDWSNPQIWERYNGSAWVAFGEPPTGSETITVVGTEEASDSVFVDVEVTVTGTLVLQGIVESNETLTIGDGGVLQYDRDGGGMPLATWAEGSTLLITGVVATAPEDRNQDYHHIVFDTPGLLSNLNMDLNGATVSGDIRVVQTGLARWYLTSATAEDSSEVTILGDVIVEGGNFAVQGTSNVSTTFIVHHYGNIIVSQEDEEVSTNFSISRGSQPLGTTTWYLYEGDFSMSSATTQSSTATPGGAKFVFASEDRQTLTLGDDVEFSALPIEVSSGTTLDMGMSTLGGGGNFVLNEGGAIATAVPGGIAEIFADVVAEVTIEENSGFEFNGSTAQITSELMPAVVSDLTIDNPEGVTLSQETTINGTLRLVSGVFDNTISFTLGPQGELSIEGGSLLVDVSSESETEVPQTLVVHQNFPNPFNPSTVIRYGLPAASDVTIRIYNVLGQEVRRLFEGLKPAGEHQVIFRAEGLGSGTYIYRVESGNRSLSRSMVLIE